MCNTQAHTRQISFVNISAYIMQHSHRNAINANTKECVYKKYFYFEYFSTPFSLTSLGTGHSFAQQFL